MNSLNKFLKEYSIKPKAYKKIGKVVIIDTNDGKYVIKEKTRNNNTNIYKYLDSRNFTYYPKLVTNETDDYEMWEYIEEIEMPNDQKIIDLIKLLSLLHSKTTFYQEINEADYKKIYEDITNNISYLDSYYNDLITVIDSRVHMSPSEYLIARNISKIFAAIGYCKEEIENWYNMVKERKKERLVVLHNDLSLNHFLKNKNSYFISWNKSKTDNPIFDLYKLYKRYGLDYDFETILLEYEKSYPLLKDEKKLLFILISLPEKIEFNDSEYELCKKISKQIDLLYKTDKLVSPQNSKHKE